jgi:hypothetical protein
MFETVRMFISWVISTVKKAKAKVSRNRSGVAQRVPGS